MIHPQRCMCDAYACRLRRKGINLSASATPTRTRDMTPTVSVPPGHWKNIATQERPDGSQMPIFWNSGDPVRHKEYSEKTHSIKEKLAAVQSGYIREVTT
jgi:hypothetical protein